MDAIKILLALFAASGVALIILRGRIGLLFWMGVFLMFSRRVNFPWLGDLEPSTVVIYFTAVLVLPAVISFIVSNYLLQLVVLALGLAGGALFHSPPEEYWSWSLTVLSVYVMCALSDLYIRDEAALERLSTLFIIISFIIGFSAVIAWLGFADNVIILSDTSPANTNDGQVLYSKTYGIAYSNTVNGFIPMALIFLYSKKWNNILRAVIFLSITASVFISLKRIAWISLFFSILYIIFRDGRPKLKPLVLGTAMVLGGMFFFGSQITERFQNIGNVLLGEVSPDENRTVRLEYAWAHFKEHPVIGNGSGEVTYVHNGFLEILVNLGLPGLVILVPWVAIPARQMLRKTGSRQKDWAIACLIYLSTLFCFEAVLNQLDLFWIFGLLYAGMESARRIYPEGNTIKNNQLWNKDGLVLR